MTSAKGIASQVGQADDLFVFPDPPEHPEDKMTSFDHLTINGNAHYLALHLGNPDTTLVAGDRYLALASTRNMAGIRYPDLLVAFGVDPEAYRRRNAYVISDQGKPPDLVMEIASPSTGRIDATTKRNDYAGLGIPEYWRFDETGESHGARLAGDRLVDGQYQSIEIDELAEDVLQGFSEVLNLSLRWERGELVWHDPATGERIATFEDERAARIAAETRADQAEARVRELEERLGGQNS